MDELVEVMKEILDELKEIKEKITDIRGAGAYSIEDIYNAMN